MHLVTFYHWKRLNNICQCVGFISVGYALHVQAVQTPKGGHSDERDHKRWSELSVSRIPTAGFKTSSVAKGQSFSQPAQEDHTGDSTLSQIQSWYPYPARRNVRKSRVSFLKKGFSSATVGRSAAVHDRSGTEAFPLPEGKMIHQVNSESVFSTDAVLVQPHVHRLSRTKLAGGFSPQVEEAPVGLGPSRRAHIYSHSSTESPNIKALKPHKTHMNPSRPNIFPMHPRGLHLPNRPDVSGNPGRSSVGKEKTPAWSPRSHSRDVTSEARGYAHVRHIKPGNDKTQPQTSSAAGRKFLETGYPSAIQNQGRYSHDLSERRQNLNYNSRGTQSSSWHPPPPDRAPNHVQGKFKPFQRLPTMDPPPHHHSSDGETEPAQTAAGTTLSPSLNCTGNTSSVVPSADGDFSTTSASTMQTESQDGESNTTSVSPMQTESQDGESNTTSASPMQTESQDATLAPQASNHDGQSESSAEVGPSVENDEPLTVFPLTVPPAEDKKGGTVVSSPSEKDQSEVWLMTFWQTPARGTPLWWNRCIFINLCVWSCLFLQKCKMQFQWWNNLLLKMWSVFPLNLLWALLLVQSVWLLKRTSLKVFALLSLQTGFLL